MKIILVIFISVLFCGINTQNCFAQASQQTTDNTASETGFISLSEDISTPSVSYLVKRSPDKLSISFKIGAFDAQKVVVDLGVSAAHKIILSASSDQVLQDEDAYQFDFDIPNSKLVDNPSQWQKLRFALVVRWLGGPLGEDRLRWRFRHLSNGAVHDPLSLNSEDWQPFNLDRYQQSVTDMNNQINIPFIQPMEGKASIVIEDDSRKRIRNLISGISISKGEHSIKWDGLDEQGKLIQPGKYYWRSIHHPGIKPEYLMTFCNWDNTGFGAKASNHSYFKQVISNGKYVFCIAPITEGGYAMIAIDTNGTWQKGYNYIAELNNTIPSVAADSTYLYVASDGYCSGQIPKHPSADWHTTANLTLTRYDIESGAAVDFPDKHRYVILESHDWGPGALNPNLNQGVSLSGIAYLNGKLYIGSRQSQAILVVDPNSGNIIKYIPVAQPGTLVTANEKLYIISEKKVLEIDPNNDQSRVIIASESLDPVAIAADRSHFYMADQNSNTIIVFNTHYKQIGILGHAGGDYTGDFDPQRMIHPCSLAVMDNKLWVAEDRINPKRVSAWNLLTKQLVIQKFGNPPYGGAGAGFDSQDKSLWLGLGASWDINLNRKLSNCTSIIENDQADFLHFHFIHQDNKTFVVGVGKATYIFRWNVNKTLTPLACFSSAHCFSYAHNWNPPDAFVEAYNKLSFNSRYRGGHHGQPSSRQGVLWIDKNDDGKMQTDEFDFTDNEIKFAGAYWGNDINDLTLRIPAIIHDSPVMVVLKPDGYYPGGAPKYPNFSDACAQGIPIDYSEREVQETITDRFGNMICKTSPNMTSFDQQGKQLWTFPNNWSGVGGSHSAPLPQVGVMQGALGFLGIAELDDKSDVFVINGNHGRFFILSSDGLYIDEAFRDARTGVIGRTPDALYLGDESFGGMFGRAEDKEYYLQTGGDGYRIYKLIGLNNIVRQTGTIDVSASQLQSASRQLNILNDHIEAKELTDQTHNSKSGRICSTINPPDMNSSEGWPKKPTVQWSVSDDYSFQAKALYDSNNLYLSYVVPDDSPWVNKGKDWSLLFKTGDAVDFQIATSGNMFPHRMPFIGDVRILIAPFEEKNIAVIYRYQVPNAKNPSHFSSPSQTVEIDEVSILPNVKITVNKEKNLYRLNATIPLSDIGLTNLEQRVSNGNGKYKGDFGIIFGDETGNIDILRTYWSNKNTGLISDVPGEAMINPDQWGEMEFIKDCAK